MKQLFRFYTFHLEDRIIFEIPLLDLIKKILRNILNAIFTLCSRDIYSLFSKN